MLPVRQEAWGWMVPFLSPAFPLWWCMDSLDNWEIWSRGQTCMMSNVDVQTLASQDIWSLKEWSWAWGEVVVVVLGDSIVLVCLCFSLPKSILVSNKCHFLQVYFAHSSNWWVILTHRLYHPIFSPSFLEEGEWASSWVSFWLLTKVNSGGEAQSPWMRLEITSSLSKEPSGQLIKKQGEQKNIFIFYDGRFWGDEVSLGSSYLSLQALSGAVFHVIPQILCSTAIK